MIAIINDWRTAVVLCLTLGLSPFFPEPHILGKIRWIAGGAVGMEWLDWFDFFLHGLPWVYLLYILNKRFFS
ncbi:MAG: hypothetical protein KF852_05995 [Saprospiraceae bacterium]|nr:hypothetical protein [Saprospiraceae bacterium]